MLWQDFIEIDKSTEPEKFIENRIFEKEIERDLERILEAIKYCDLQKISLLHLYKSKLKEMDQLQSKYKKEEAEIKSELDFVCTIYKEKILKIEINNNLATMPKVMTSNQYQKLRRYYLQQMNEGVNKVNPNITFEKAFILIKHIFPTKRIRDFDNMFTSFIFDGLRSNRIIKNDDFNTISYFEKGEYQEGISRTEIYVTDTNHMIELLKEKG